MVYPRPESCDTPRALMSVTPNLCCNETEPRSIHSPDSAYAVFSLQHQTLLLSPVSSTTGHCFLFGPISLFFLELFLHSSPVAYWAPTDLGSSLFSVISSCLILFLGFSRQEYWSRLLFPSTMDHILSELSIMSHPSWVALHGMPHDFIELDKAVERVRGRKECLEAPKGWNRLQVQTF